METATQDDFWQMVIKFDVADIIRAVELSLRNNTKKYTVSVNTVIELMGEELLTSWFELCRPDFIHPQGSYDFIADIMSGDYATISTLLALRMEAVLNEIMEEPLMRRSNVVVKPWGAFTFTLFSNL
jgi:hypothetical protein